MFGYQITNQKPTAPSAPATKRRASRAVRTSAAIGVIARVITRAIGSTGICVRRTRPVSLNSVEATT